MILDVAPISAHLVSCLCRKTSASVTHSVCLLICRSLSTDIVREQFEMDALYARLLNWNGLFALSMVYFV